MLANYKYTPAIAMFEEPVSIKNSNCRENKFKMFQSKRYEKKFDLRWLKTVSSTFQGVDFDGSL